MTMRRVLASAGVAVLISASVLVMPLVGGGAEAQPAPPLAASETRVVAPGISADRDVGEATVVVTQGDVRATIDTRLAATDVERERGLMWITSMPEDAGMLFLFPGPLQSGFWMANTYLPLDIAFVGADGTVLSIKRGTPLDLTLITPGATYLSVLETNAGWWAAHGLSAGAHVELPPGLPEAS